GTRTGDTNAEIARSRAMQENPVMLYIAENCDSCDLVSRILESNNVPYDKTQVDNDPEAQKILLDLVGSLRVPTITIGEIVIEGSNRATIEDTLRRNGYPQVQSDPVPQ
ncbi:MAG: glutaredoxin family protein, partial [Proteobacteria bacterium]|nr:glutaredoxin family protein [Pseudomonadota bacterium]